VKGEIVNLWNQLRTLCVAVFPVLLLSGCGVQPLKTVEYPPDTRVGIVNLVGDKIAHSHIGATIFGNKVTLFEVDANVSSYALERLKKLLARDGRFIVVEVDASTSGSSPRDELVEFDHVSRYSFSPKFMPTVERLASSNDLQVLLVVHEENTTDWIGDSAGRLNGYGL